MVPRIATVLLVILSFIQRVESYDGYSNSFIFITARNKETGEKIEVCGNYLQFKTREVAATYDEAKPVGVAWWRGIYNNTKVCPLQRADEPATYTDMAVPLAYRIDDDGTQCTKPFSDASTGFKNASQFSITQVSAHGAAVSILLVDKGRSFITKWRDFLFSEFSDPFINQSSITTLFLYTEVFYTKILDLVKNDVSHLELRYHRPESSRFDLSMVIIWLLAMVCVAGGGVWAFHRHKLGKDMQMAIQEAERRREESEAEADGSKKTFCTRYANTLAILFLMSILITILMLGYFFRNVLVLFFNLMLIGFGSFSVYGCVRALLSNFSCSAPTCCTAPICSRFPEMGCISHKPTLRSITLYTASLALCIFWYFNRLGPYAFILLDFINVTLCLHILKSLRLPSLKWISGLMMCMFVYDAFMVFITPLFTSNGCSVMLEVATGVDCSSRSTVGYTMPPIDAQIPEKFPMLMQVMHFDPMIRCIDLEVERGFQMTILGLGDIIIPGYLVTHCFTMGGFAESTRLIYGVVCIIGYGLGLLATFLALTIMSMAQPALIYLVPFTLIPIILLSLKRGEFHKVWNGALDNNDTTEESESGPFAVTSVADTEETDSGSGEQKV